MIKHTLGDGAIYRKKSHMMKIRKKCQNAVISFLERRYPGVREVVDLLGNKVNSCKTDFHALNAVLDKIRERVDNNNQYVEGVTE